MTSLDGLLISGSGDNTIKIWDPRKGELLQTLSGHQNSIMCMTSLDGQLISGSTDHTIKLWDFNFPSVAFKKISKDRWGEDLPLLLIDLGIVTKEEYSEKLKCKPSDLPARGICSAEDLQALYLHSLSVSPDFQYLQIVSEEAANDLTSAAARVFKKQEVVSKLLDELSTAAQKKFEEIRPYLVIRDESGNVYDAVNPWSAFLEELEKAQADLRSGNLTPQQFAEKFNPKNYAELVKKANALIDGFRAAERKTQILILDAYINQWGILKKWNSLHKQEIHSLSALLKRTDAPQDIFRMGK
jgi:hypothetical protein